MEHSGAPVQMSPGTADPFHQALDVLGERSMAGKIPFTPFCRIPAPEPEAINLQSARRQLFQLPDQLVGGEPACADGLVDRSRVLVQLLAA